MALILGDTIFVRAQARDPFTHEPLDPMPVEAFLSIWAPGQDRRTEKPKWGPYQMQRDVTTKFFSTYVQTDPAAGWKAGHHDYEILVQDRAAGVVNRERSKFLLEE